MRQHIEAIEAGARKAVMLKNKIEEVKDPNHEKEVRSLNDQAFGICGNKLVGGQNNAIYAIINKLFQNSDNIKSSVERVIECGEGNNGFERYQAAIKEIKDYINQPEGINDMRNGISDENQAIGLIQKEMREALKIAEEEALKEALEKNPEMKDLVVIRANRDKIDEKVKDEKYKLICVEDESKEKAEKSWGDNSKQKSMIAKYKLKKLQEEIEESRKRKLKKLKKLEEKLKKLIL